MHCLAFFQAFSFRLVYLLIENRLLGHELFALFLFLLFDEASLLLLFADLSLEVGESVLLERLCFEKVLGTLHASFAHVDLHHLVAQLLQAAVFLQFAVLSLTEDDQKLKHAN